MGRSTRNDTIQDLDRAIGNIQSAEEKLARMVENYTEFHPDIAARVLMIIEGLEIAIELIELERKAL